jgi:hypothetical protein
MQRRLSKEESRQRYAQGRKLWNEFDPIGVVDAVDVDDEYDSYVGPCLRIVESGKGVPELVTYVRWVVFEHMGLSETLLGQEGIEAFSRKFCEWYRASWADTVV